MSNNHIFVRKNDNLAIVGSHKTTRDGHCMGQPGWDGWVFNEAAMQPWANGRTGVFQMHQEKNFTTTNGIGTADNWSFIQQDFGPDFVIWMQYDEPRVPNSVKYPLEEMKRNFSPLQPTGERPFATSTPSWALALGLYLGYKKIHVWGVDLSSNTEYTYQANAWRYWWGVAKGMLGENAQIVSGGKQLFAAKLYGYDDDTRTGADYYKQRVAFHDAYWGTAKKRCEGMKGKLVDILAGKEEVKGFMDALKNAMEAYATYGKTAGAMSEANRLSERAEILHRQEFEFHAAKSQEEAKKIEKNLWKSIGHLEYSFNVWAQTQNPDAREQTIRFLDATTGLSYQLGFMNGKAAEDIFYIREFDQRLTDAAGGAMDDEVLAASLTEVKA